MQREIYISCDYKYSCFGEKAPGAWVSAGVGMGFDGESICNARETYKSL